MNSVAGMDRTLIERFPEALAQGTQNAVLPFPIMLEANNIISRKIYYSICSPVLDFVES